MAEIKDRLAEALKVKGMKAVDLCNATQIPKSAISYYLAGKSKPKSDRIYLISKALDVSEAWLMGFDVDKTRTTAQKKNDDLAEIIVLMRKDSEFYDVVLSIKKLKDTSEKQYEVIKQLLSTFED